MSYLQQKSVGTDFLMLGFLFPFENFLNFQTHAITAFININRQNYSGLLAFSCLFQNSIICLCKTYRFLGETSGNIMAKMDIFPNFPHYIK